MLFYVFLTTSDVYKFTVHFYFFFCELPVQSLPTFPASGLALFIDEILDFFMLDGNVMWKTSHAGRQTWLPSTGTTAPVWKVALGPSCGFTLS